MTPDPGLPPGEVRTKVATLAKKCRRRNIRFGHRPQLSDAVMDHYYRPGARLDGRCLYPFIRGRVSFGGKMHFCPLIRIEVGDLTKMSLEDIWNGERYVELRRRLLEHKLFPVCQRCCKAELSTTVADPYRSCTRRRRRPPRDFPPALVKGVRILAARFAGRWRIRSGPRGGIDAVRPVFSAATTAVPLPQNGS